MSSPKTHLNDSIRAINDNTPLGYSAGERPLPSQQPKHTLASISIRRGGPVRRHPHVTPDHTKPQFLHSLRSRVATTLLAPRRSLPQRVVDDRYCLVNSRVPDLTLAKAWPAIGEEVRRHYVQRVAGIGEKMAGWKSKAARGVDGGR